MFKTLEWTQDGVVMIDQRKLPGEELYPVFKTYQEVAEAIRDMVVRGAPAIGVAAAMGVALGVKHIQTEQSSGIRAAVWRNLPNTRLNAPDSRQPLLGD